MTDTTLNLGGFIFENMEIPAELNLGGEHSLNIHKLVGGQRIIDALGSDEGEISWEGLMLGPDALNRALTLDGMRAAGQQIDFSVFNTQYNVVISKFSFIPERYYQVKYEISLVVVENLSLQSSSTTISGFADAILGDFASASALATSINIPSITSSMGTLNNMFSAIPDLYNANHPALNSISSQISTIQGQVSSQLSSVTSSLFG